MPVRIHKAMPFRRDFNRTRTRARTRARLPYFARIPGRLNAAVAIGQGIRIIRGSPFEHEYEYEKKQRAKSPSFRGLPDTTGFAGGVSFVNGRACECLVTNE